MTRCPILYFADSYPCSLMYSRCCSRKDTAPYLALSHTSPPPTGLRVLLCCIAGRSPRLLAHVVGLALGLAAAAGAAGAMFFSEPGASLHLWAVPVAGTKAPLLLQRGRAAILPGACDRIPFLSHHAMPLRRHLRGPNTPSKPTTPWAPGQPPDRRWRVGHGLAALMACTLGVRLCLGFQRVRAGRSTAAMLATLGEAGGASPAVDGDAGVAGSTQSHRRGLWVRVQSLFSPLETQGGVNRASQKLGLWWGGGLGLNDPGQ